MNKPSETHKPKGISVEGFWRALKNNDTVEKDSEQKATNSCDVSEANCHVAEANIELRELPEDPKDDDWEFRFDKWLDSL